MKTITNRTGQPVRVPLGGGKILHLGPRKTGQISDEETKNPKVVAMIKSGLVEVTGENHGPEGADTASGRPAEATHGHPQTTRVNPKGNR